MLPSLPRRHSTSRGRFHALWLLPVLLALVLLYGLFPQGHHGLGQLKLRAASPTRYASQAGDPQTAKPAVSAPVIHVSLPAHPSERALPSSFLGLSTESWDIQSLDSDPGAADRVLGLLKAPGDGDLTLRVGGQSTEQTYWDAPKLGVGTEAFRPGAAWLKTLAALTRSARLHLLVDLNLVAHSSSMAAAFAKALYHAMPKGSIADFEVGNEPDIGHRQVTNPLAPPGEKVPKTPKGWDEYTVSQYLSLFRSYAKAVHKVAPSIHMAGPEIFFAGRDVSWAQKLVKADRSRLGMLTVHRYPLSACTTPSAGDYATIARVLGPNASGGLANEMVDAVHVGQQSKLPVRLSEFNSVTCGGRAGVSNSFATALWAPDTLFSMWNVGVAGVNLHLQPAEPNTAFSVSSSGLTVHPLLYGMILFTRALGTDAHLVSVHSSGDPSANVRVWAVKSKPNELKVLVLDKGDQTVNLALALGSHGKASVQRLSASGPGATSGVTLAAQRLGAQGQWVGKRVTQSVTPSHGTYRVPMGAYSGALVTVHL